MKKRTVKKWIWGMVGAILLILLLGQATLMFFGDEILKESILRAFSHYSENNYEEGKRPSLDFDNLSINIFTGNISLSGLYFSGYLYSASSNHQQPDHIQMAVPEAKIEGIKFLDLYKLRELHLDHISFYHPEIQFLSAVQQDSITQSPKETIQHLSANLQQHLNEYVKSVTFNSFKLIDGNIFLTQQKSSGGNHVFTSIRNKFHAQHVHIELFDFLLDSLSAERSERVFFVKDFDIKLKDYQLLLSDSTYLLRADTLGFSTKLKRIYLKEFKMLPINAGNENELSINIPEVHLTEIDWIDLYFDSLLIAEQLVFNSPSVALKIRQDSLKDHKFFRLDAINPDSLYDKLSAEFSKLHINDLVLNKGRLQVQKYAEDTLQILEIEEANLLLAHLKLDSLDELDTLSSILPADKLLFNLKKIKLYLPDQKHYFTAENASLMTERQRNFACDVHFNEVLFKPGVDSLEVLLLNPPSQPLAYDVIIPSVSFFGIQLEHMALQNAAVLDSIYIRSPKITIANFAPQSVGKQASGLFNQSQAEEITPESVRTLLYDWSNARLNLNPILAPGDSSALFQWLKAGEVQIDSGQFHILKAKDDLSAFTQVTSVDTFYAYLNNISIDGLDEELPSDHNSKVAVLATDVDFYFQQSEFLLPGDHGDGGLLRVEDARISTQTKEAYLKRVYFWANAENLPSREVWLHKMYIPYVQFNNIDLKKIYVEQDAEIAHLAVYSPQITLNYKENDQYIRNQHFDIEDIYPQLSPYLQRLYIPNAKINKAKFLLQKISERGVEPLFKTQQLDIHLKGFYLDSLTTMNRIRPFYADLLDISVKDYQWNFYPEDETYPLLGVKGGNMHYNSYEGQLDLNELSMLTNLSNNPDVQRLEIYCDKIMADGIDTYRLIHDRLLQVGRLTVKAPSFQVEEKPHTDDQQQKVLSRQSLQPDLNKLLNKNLQNIHFRYVNVEQGKLSYLQRLANDTLSFVSVDKVDFKAKNIRVNHQNSRHLHHILYADEIDFSFFADHLLVNRGESKQKVELKEAYFSSTDSHLSIGKLNILPPKNVFEQKDKTHFTLNTKKLNLRGLDFKQAYLYGDFHVQQINIADAALKVYLGAHQSTPNNELTSIHEVISPFLENLIVDKIAYPQSTLEIYDKKSGKLSFASTKVHANISNFYLNQSSLDQENSSKTMAQRLVNGRMFFSDDISITIQDYRRFLGDGLYRLSTEAINIASGNKKISISGLKLQPQLSRGELLRKYQFSKSLANLDVDYIELDHVDFESLFEDDKLIVEQLNVYEPNLMVFRDNQLPRDSSRRPGLHQELLFDLDYIINIKNLEIFDGMITYAERAADAEQEGTITFEDLHANATHITNDPAVIKDNLEANLSINAKVMGEGELETSFRFPLGNKDLKFYVQGTLGKMDLTKFNQMLEPVAFVHIKEGINQGMRFDFSGDKHMSEGTMEFRYNDLSIQMKDKVKGNTGLDEKLSTFIANAFVLKANNPKAVFLRIGNIEYQRDKSRAMFHFWWQSILSGVKSSIGLEKNMEKTKDFAELEKN